MNAQNVVNVTLQEAHKLLNSDPVFRKEHLEIDLAQVKLLTPGSAEICGDTYIVSSQGQRSLCDILEMPYKFFDQLSADYKELWDEVIHRLEERRNQVVRFSVNKEKDVPTIRAFNPVSTPWIEDLEFLKMVEHVCSNKTVPAELKKVLLWRDGVSAEFVAPGVEGFLSKVKGKPDIFKLGLDLFNSSTVSFRSGISFALERMVCSNRATRREKGYKWQAIHRGSSENLVLNFYNGVNNLLSRNISFDKYLTEKIGGLLESQASLKELLMAEKALVYSCSEIRSKILDFDERVPVDKTLKAYQLTKKEAENKSEIWKMSASTPISLYDLFNNCTWIASNAPKLEDDERFELQIQLGNVFFNKKSDLVDVAPEMHWN